MIHESFYVKHSTLQFVGKMCSSLPFKVSKILSLARTVLFHRGLLLSMGSNRTNQTCYYSLLSTLEIF